MKVEELKDEVMRIMGNIQTGQKTSQLMEILEESLDEEIAERTLQESLKELHNEGRLSRERMSDGSPGAPPYYYFLPDPESYENPEEIDEADEYVEIGGEKYPVQFRGDITPPDESEQRDLLLEIADQHLKDADYVQEIRDHAPEIAEKDPREMLAEFAEWTADKINKKGKEIYRLQERGQIRKFTRKKDELQEFIGWAEKYFQRVYRLDYEGKEGVAKKDQRIMEIPDIRDFYGENIEGEDDVPQVSLDKEAMRERLAQRVFGESVIMEVEKEEDVSDFTAAGTDASVAEIDLPSDHPQMTQTIFKLFTGAAALRKADQSYTDFDFEPESFKRYRDREAFRDGLLVSNRVFHELSESQQEKAEYAAMDLRQYNENMRVATNRANWRPVGELKQDKVDLQGPEIIYSDGRIFPLVHQISDYESTNIYGELVRNEVRRFAEMMEAAKEDYLMVDSIFAGVVKNPGINLISPLVFWYIYGKNGENEGEEVPEEIYRPNLSESMVSHLLFSGLSEEPGFEDNGTIFSTFRILRRFHEVSLDFDRDIPPTTNGGELIDVTSPQDWREFFKKRVEDKEERGHPTLDLEDYDPFVLACAQAATVTTFAAPKSIYSGPLESSDLRMLLPRIEIGIAKHHDPEEEMRKTLSWYSENLEMDDAHSSGDFSGVSELPVLVPSVIVESDDAAKFARDTMGEDVREELRGIIKRLRQQR